MTENQQIILQGKEALKHNTGLLNAAETPKKKKKCKRGLVFAKARQERYLAVLKETGEPAAACEEVGILSRTVNGYRKKYPEFAEAEAEAMRTYRARLAMKVHERGVDGIQEPVFWQGIIVGWVTKYSDRMLELQVKRHIPEYRDKVTVENNHSGAVGLLADLGNLPENIRAELKDLLKKVEGLEADEE